MKSDTKSLGFQTYSVKKDEPKCALCGGKAESVCWECLYATIEVALGKMAEDGRLGRIITEAMMKGGR